MARSETYNKMIHSRQWRNLRARVLAEYPCCQRCQQQGRVAVAEEVHHVTPVQCGATPAEQRRLMFNPANLRALCRRCHSQTHIELQSNSPQQARQRNDRAVEGFIARYLDE